MKQYISKNKEIISYLIVGICTVFITILVYYFLRKNIFISSGQIDILLSNVISWTIAVLFSYFLNSKYVFKSNKKGKERLLEIIHFFIMRIITLGIDVGLMFFFTSFINLNDIIAKVIVQIVVIVANYLLSKLIIFNKSKVNIQQMIVNKNQLFFHFGLNILIFIISNIIVSTTLFIFKFSISINNFFIACVITLIVSYLIMRKNNYQNKTIIKMLLTSTLVIAFSIFLSNQSLDYTYDGNSYHKDAIGTLARGWNPVYEKMSQTNEKDQKDEKFNTGDNRWVIHYGKNHWIFAANIYIITGNIESGKSFNFLVAISTLSIVFSIFMGSISIIISAILSLLLIFSPIFIVQTYTYYNDGSLGVLTFLLIFSLIIIKNNKTKICDKEKLLLYSITLMLMINLKFTGFIFAAFFSLGFFVYYLFDKKFVKKHLKNFLMTGFVSLVFSINIIGLSTYPKNLLTKGHVFYPLMGEGAYDIMTTNQPKSFSESNRIKNFFVANFSESQNITYSTGAMPRLKIPFTFSVEEVLRFKASDMRMGGYGVLFSGILIISFIAFVYALVYLYKTNRETFFNVLIPTLVSLLFLFIQKDFWLARYFVLLYALPVITVFSLFVIDKKKSIGKIIILLLVINNLSIFIVNRYYNTILFSNENKARLNEIKKVSKESEIKVFTPKYRGTVYNVFDNHRKIEVISGLENINLNDYREIKIFDVTSVYIPKEK